MFFDVSRCSCYIVVCCFHVVRAEIMKELQNLSTRDLQQFHKKFLREKSKRVSAGTDKAFSQLPPTITTPEGHTAIDCLHQVEGMTKSAMAKNVATTRRGRRKLTEIYNRMRKGKKDKLAKKGRKLRQYDLDGKGDARFETAYKLMLVEGYNANKAALQVVGKQQQNAFRIAFGISFVFLVFIALICSIVTTHSIVTCV